MKQKKYWKGLEELHDQEGYKKATANEFKEELPFEESDHFLKTATPRRDFLKYMGFSVTAATLAASCEIKVRKVVPYLNKPEDITPGVPNYYASSYAVDGDYCPVVIKTRDGRPIKVEGNTLSSITEGGTSARVQASVLSLYDVTRLRYPMAGGKETTWEALDQHVGQALGSVGSNAVVLLSTSLMSPSLNQAIQDFLKKFPNSRHVVYDPVSYSSMLQANEASYGKRALPSYHFENAQCIVSLGADFLGTWLSPVEFASQYAKNRKIDQDKPQMSRHFHFESGLSLTGSNADYRFAHKPSQAAAVIMALYNGVATALGKATLSGAPAIADAKLAAGIQKAAKNLAAHAGQALVVSGSQNPNDQILVNALNDMLGAGGKTIDWSSTVNYRQGYDPDVEQLIADMEAGKVGALLIYGANPSYSYPHADRFNAALKKVATSISFNDHNDETTQLCGFAAPDSHYLESWGDAEPKTGYYSLQQPGIAPLFKTRPFLETLLAWSGTAHPDALEYIQAYWKQNIFPTYGSGDWQTWWDASLQNGVVEPKAAAALSGLPFKADAQAAAAKLLATAPKAADYEVVLYEKIGILNGRIANSPWLQEMPDPISKVTYDNYVCVSENTAKQLNAFVSRFNEWDYHRPVAQVTVNGQSVRLPILQLPGIPDGVLAVALGYGRAGNDLKGDALKQARRDVGVTAAGLGINVYPWASYNSQTQTYQYTTVASSITNTGDTTILALTQSHNSVEGRPIIQETTLEEFAKDPEELLKETKEEMEKYGGDNYAKNATLYPDEFDYSQGIHWGMSIDLNSCIGCGACTVACMAENNVAVVGKTEVARGHEMQWLRIDRYFSGDATDPQVVFQPMLCQQCNNAPCENVCPVNATNHSDEGLNQMVYNRCIGTRYCMNNCPYKVRRFNWRDYTGADSFEDNQYDDPNVVDMNEALTRMVLNPDVAVRSRGVMEKCSFCVQRLQDAKLKAKKEDRVLRDGDAVTACQQACPTKAIAFGNINDKSSVVYELRHSKQTHRSYRVLEDLHTLPNITYMAKISNKEPQDFYTEGLQHVL